MAAKDYGFFPSELTGIIYLAKRIKSKNLMSQDRREVTDNEVIGMFEHFLKRWCEENKTDTICITGDDGKEIFRAVLKTEEKVEK